MRVVVMNQVTLDGVMQGVARPDEDTRGGFEPGGWGITHANQAMVDKMGERMGGDHAFLFGRRTYEELLATWNARGGPFKDALNNTRKYVASSTSGTKLEWPNSTLLHGDVPAAVGELRKQPGGNLVIMGSGRLIRSLLPHGLIDELLLMIHPLVVGSGQRLFEHDDHCLELRLVHSVATSTGVILATYQPADE
jgi:dihydrofolate reductase